MATLVKEKRREKKKPKVKNASLSSVERDEVSALEGEVIEKSHITTATDLTKTALGNSPECVNEANASSVDEQKSDTQSKEQLNVYSEESEQTSSSNINITTEIKIETQMPSIVTNIEHNKYVSDKTEIETDTSEALIGNTYHDLNKRLERIAIPNLDPNLDIEQLENRLGHSEAYIKQTTQESVPLDNALKTNEENIESKLDQIKNEEIVQEIVTPSAPMLEEVPVTIAETYNEEVQIEKPKTQSMPLEEAIRLYGGAEMADIRAMSEREEALVDAGPVSGPEHPLVDLLSTFRSSLRAVERERTQLACGFAEEEKTRNTLWKVEKKYVTVSDKCVCGLNVDVKATYEHAELEKSRLPVAKMKLESLLRDVQDSYCHHQHSALLAHCQIEELISETIQSNKNVIREALALILQALRVSDSGPDALATALQRWAAVLSAALLDGRDCRQLLYLIHHLFRQTRSVRWAARVIHISVLDRSSTAQAIALLDLLLARPKLEAAVECTEDTDEAWEEVDKHGDGSAVSEGSLRERDLLALLRTFPLRDLVARIVLFTHSDIKQAREYEWGDASGGRGVLKACCGARALLHTLQRAALTHPHYTRLIGKIRSLAVDLLHALAALHMHTRHTYHRDLEDKITGELEACFIAGVQLLGAQQLHELPATLLSEHTVKDYCTVLIAGLHDKNPNHIDSLSIQLPMQSCSERTQVIAQAALDRTADNELARIVLEFLIQTGIKRTSVNSKCPCETTGRELLPRLVGVHTYLHTMAFHVVADLCQVEAPDPSSVKPLSAERWRPTPGEAIEVLEHWRKRWPTLLPHLLLALDYTPHSGISLETQLTIGRWLCEYQKTLQPKPYWPWKVLRRLRVHGTFWNQSLDAPPPDSPPTDIFSSAFAVLSSSWGHCVPLICSEGVSALTRIASSRPREAAYCLAPVMAVMAHSPESVSLTPQFAELFNTLLSSGPTMMQRALGRGPLPGAELVQRILLAQLAGDCPAGIPRASILSAWLHALWRVHIPSASVLDTALLQCREWTQLDAHAALLLQEENAKEYLNQAVRNALTAPLICESLLRAAYSTIEARTGLSARLLDALHAQSLAGQKAHVDQALKLIGSKMSSEELVIYRTATAAISAPLQHPSHLTLWRLLLHLYLQRPPCSNHESTPPVGPLFFSGLIKSRTLAQIKKRLLDTVSFHHTEAEALKQQLHEENIRKPAEVVETLPKRSEDGLLPTLNINDLTGESSESETSSEEEREENRVEVNKEGGKKKDVYNLMCYHLSAEKMILEYIRWVDDGLMCRAMPHHADIARFIAEQALEAAWNHEFSRTREQIIENKEPQPSSPRESPPVPSSPFQMVITRLLRIKERSRMRSRRPSIKSPVEDINYKDLKALLNCMDKYLADIEALAHEWSKEVSRVSTLDTALWELVAALRVRRALPPVKQRCANGCNPLTLVIPHEEWCISTGAERGIKENRQSARASIRRLARPRPHAAKCAAALHTIARKVSSTEMAVRVCERVWRVSDVGACSPAAAALSTLVEYLAERWLCANGRTCAELLSRWCKASRTPLQLTWCGSLVSPRKLPASAWPDVYTTLLRATLPPHAAFSYLSRFEMSWWTTQAEPAARRQVLDELVTAAQRCEGDEPQLSVLLELLGVHSATLLTPAELPAHLARCARAAARGALPPPYCAHGTRAAAMHAASLPFDKLGHLLRELGVIWWEARSALKKPIDRYCVYAPHIAELLRTLQRAFVAATVALSYSPERVALYAWSSLLESWAPWIVPHSAALPLLPSTGEDEAYTPMLRHFVDNVNQIMLDCPGTEERLLQQIFDWTIQTYLSVQKAAPQECHVQVSALLAELKHLPWAEHPWFNGDCLRAAIQVATSNDKEIICWSVSTWEHTRAETWLRDVTDETVAPRLAALLYLFTATSVPEMTLDEATRLPWWRLPGPALDEAFDRFFAQYHSPSMPYHELPQFRVLLSASELSVHPSAPVLPQSRGKRCAGVSHWTRAACAPALATHAPAYCRALLGVLCELAPKIEASEGEIEELLGRAVIVMCMESVAPAALPVWQSWVSSTSGRMVRACLSAAGALTAFEYFATLADTALRAHLMHEDCTGWSEVRQRWQSCHWKEPAPLAARGKLHAAYGVLQTHKVTYEETRTTLLALLAAKIHFIEEEAIIATWILAACRVARECPAQGEAMECAGAARAVLARWADEPRRSLLRVVTMQTDPNCPTPQHRLLCRLALCILLKNEVTIKAYEASCNAVLGSNSDVITWGRNPHPKRLPRLATRLYPTREKYFRHELDLAPNDS